MGADGSGGAGAGSGEGRAAACLFLCLALCLAGLTGFGLGELARLAVALGDGEVFAAGVDFPAGWIAAMAINSKMKTPATIPTPLRRLREACPFPCMFMSAFPLSSDRSGSCH